MTFRSRLDPSPDLTPQQVFANKVDALTRMLTHLYHAAAVEHYQISKAAYKLFIGKPLDNKTKEDALAKAAAAIGEFRDNFNLHEAYLLRKTYTLLLDGCKSGDTALFKSAFDELNSLGLTDDDIRAFLEVRLPGLHSDPDFRILGLLGYASKHQHVAVVEELLKHGANPNARPLLEEEKSGFDNKPIFFSVVTDVKKWNDHRSIQDRVSKEELVPFETSMRMISAYLSYGYDINLTSHQGLNVLQHAYLADSVGDMKYHVHQLAYKIAELVRFGKIQVDTFLKFANTLKEAKLFLLFPVLVTEYEKIWGVLNTDPVKARHEKIYYCLKSFLFNIISLCEYEKFRMAGSWGETVKPSSKYVRLSSMITFLKKLQNEHFKEYDPNEDLSKWAVELQSKQLELDKILKRHRHATMDAVVSFFFTQPSDKSDAEKEWEPFLTMNKLETDMIIQASRASSGPNEMKSVSSSSLSSSTFNMKSN